MPEVCTYVRICYGLIGASRLLSPDLRCLNKKGAERWQDYICLIRDSQFLWFAMLKECLTFQGLILIKNTKSDKLFA